MSLCWIEFVIFKVFFNADITTRVNGEYPWDHHQNIKGLAI